MRRAKTSRRTLLRNPPPEWSKGLGSHWAVNTTVRCQHRCVYCFEGDRHGAKDVSCAETKALLDQAAKEVPAVIFMGAEPTLNPKLPELIRHAKSRGLSVQISTNALRLADWDYLLSLLRAGLDGLEFSFPYPDARVYSLITRAAPAGFPRLLQAVDNIARWKRYLCTDHVRKFNVNIVVSRFNVEHLDDVLGHLTRHLDPRHFTATFKRLDMAPVLHEESFRRHMYVPLADLRRCLAPLAAHVRAGMKLGFRDFPLCAIPGLESFDHDLGYRLNDVRVKQNFFHQGLMVDMYPEETAGESHPFGWLCENCSLSPLCLRRGLFLQAASLPEHLPQPRLAGLPKDLDAWVRRRACGAKILASPRRRTALGWALGALLQAAPPRRPLAGKSLSWTPLERGRLRLSSGSRCAFLSLTPEDGGWRLAGTRPAWAAAGIAVLEERLGRLPAPPADCRPEPAREITASSPSRSATPPRWDRFVDGPWISRWLAEAGREPSLKSGRLEACSGGIIRARGPAAGDEGEFEVSPRDGPKSLGFLCGPLRLKATWLGSAEGALLWLRTAYAACAALEDKGAWPAVVPRRPGTFLARVWKVFGAALMPRASGRGGLLGGWVSDDGLELELVRISGQPYGSIRLAPSALVHMPYACGRGIGLQHTLPRGLRDESRWLAIVNTYARALGGPRK
jgi:pyruvate-formate lyase-activating enzyme